MPRLLHAPIAAVARRCVLILAAVLGPVLLRAEEPDQPAHPQRTYTVGVLDDNPPFSFRDADGMIRGYAVDLLAAIERGQQLTLERRVGSTAEINGAFERGELDMLQSYVPNADRLRFADFSMPYLRMNGMIFVRRTEQAIARLEDLRGRRVLVHRGSTGARILEENGLQASIVTVGSVEECFRMLAAGIGDATLASRLTGETMIRELGLREVLAVGEPVPGYSVNYCFAIRRGLDPLLGSVEEGLALLDRAERGGVSPKQRIYDRWFGFVDPRFSRTEIAAAISTGLGVALIVAIWALLRQRRLRAQITRQARQLQASEERYRTVFASTLHGLIVLERSATHLGLWIVVEINDAARRILGAPASGPGPLTLEAAFPADRALTTRVEATLEAEQPAPFEHQRTAPDGAAWIDVAVSRLGRHGRLVALRDISEARRAREKLQQTEMQLRQNQKLEAIGTLASGIAHDFNNILTAILGNTELMRLELPAGQEAAGPLQEIHHAAERARFLVRQILTFSRRTEARRAVISATRIVKETLRFVSATAPSSIEFRHRIGGSSPEIEMDPTQLHQVLMNLCTNAVQASRGGTGMIEVTEDEVQVGTDPQDHPAGLPAGRYLMLGVRDTGGGMPAEVLQRIFEPFFTTRPAGEGTGLGLAVVHDIVTASGGAIDVASMPGRGTTFRLYLPASTRSSPVLADDPGPAPRGRGQHILLVDDEPAIVQSAGTLLERLGYVVTTFSQPAEAAAEFERRGGAFDLLITDLTMPRATGIDLPRRLRDLRPDLPVVLISGFMNDRELALARAARIDRVLDKPVTAHALAQAVAVCLENANTSPGPAPVSGSAPVPSGEAGGEPRK